MGQTHVAPGTIPATITTARRKRRSTYVLSGTQRSSSSVMVARSAWKPGPGDYIFVAPYVPHREENPGATEAVVIIARSSQEAIVVNLDRLWPGDCS